MSVAVDATGTKLIGASSVTSIDYTGITVGSALSNSALIVTLVLGATATSSGFAATWDSGGTNQAMTLLGSANIPSAGGNVILFGLRNPTSGNKTLHLSWTTAQFPVVCAISLTGVEQSSDAAAFAHFNSATGTGTSASVAVTSATGDMVIGVSTTSGTISSVGNTQIYLDTTTNGADSGAERAAGAASVSVTATNSASNAAWAIAGIDVVASTGGISGTLAVTDSPDSVSFSGDVKVSGSLSVTDTADTVSFNVTSGVTGTLSTTDTPDSVSFSGSVVVSGGLATTDNPDTVAFSGNVILSASLATTDNPDTVSFNGSVSSSITATLAITDTPDTVVFVEQGSSGTWRWLEGYEEYVTKRTTEIKQAASVLSRMGGHARAASLTPKQRSNIASIAANARWK